jgi:hypothetical protein
VESEVVVPIYGQPKSSALGDVVYTLGDNLKKRILFALFRILNRRIFAFLNVRGKFLVTTVGFLRLGDFYLLLCPGELFYGLGEYVLRAVPGGPHKGCIVSMTNDYASYLYPLAAYYEGGYENEFQLAPRAGSFVAAALRGILAGDRPNREGT